MSENPEVDPGREFRAMATLLFDNAQYDPDETIDPRNDFFLIVAGDSIHPRLGACFLGDNWRELDEKTLVRRLAARDRESNRHICAIIERIKSGDSIEEIRRIADSVPHKIASACSPEIASIEDALKEMSERGVEIGEHTIQDFVERPNGGFAILAIEHDSNWIR